MGYWTGQQENRREEIESAKLFVQAVFDEMTAVLDRCKDSLRDPDKPLQNDEPWSRARSVLVKLPEEDREKVFGFLRLAAADTASLIFGTIDGSHFPQGIEEDFTLKYGGEEIQGFLQDAWIEIAQDAGVYR